MRQGLTQTSLYSYRSRLEALDFRFKKKRDLLSVYYSESKGADQLSGTAKLVCTFVFALCRLLVF